MNLTLNYHKEFESNLVKANSTQNGIRYRFRFENGYGASVIKTQGSYGSYADLWELAVLYFRGDDFYLTYKTPITDDVRGWLTDEEVNELLGEIRDLPNPHEES